MPPTKQSSREPSKASLREMPEIDFSKARVLGRGLHAAKARRSFASVLIERKLFDKFGSEEAIVAALRSFVEAVEAMRGARPKAKRAGAGSTKPAV